MKNSLPPLHAVVAFVTVARLKSFKKAGDNLCVTPSAISHQVRVLEEWLGLRLFERSTRSVELTDIGIRCFMELNPLIAELEKFSKNKLSQRGKKIITIQTTDSFASRWLIPRLSEFEKLNQDIVIKIVTYDYRNTLRSSEADLGILFMCEDTHSNILKTNTTKLLFEEKVFPVCNAKIGKKLKSSNISELSNFPLIHDDNMGVSWDDWIVANEKADAKTHDIPTKSGAHYNHSHLALRAAELGNGFTLASNVLVKDAIKSGLLIAPFKKRISVGCGYYLVQPKKLVGQEEHIPFIKWITSYSH